jgi:hypothetical protein
MWIYTSAHVVREFEHIKQAGKESGTSGYGAALSSDTAATDVGGIGAPTPRPEASDTNGNGNCFSLDMEAANVGGSGTRTSLVEASGARGAGPTCPDDQIIKAVAVHIACAGDGSARSVVRCRAIHLKRVGAI